MDSFTIPSAAWPVLVALATAVPLAACSDAAGPVDGFTQADAEALGDFIGSIEADGPELPSLSVTTSGSLTPALARRGSYSRTAECAAGGTRSVQGTTQSDFDPETRIVQTTWSHTHSFDDCAIPLPPATLTLNGSVTGQGSGSFQMPAEPSQPRTVLSLTGTRTGVIDWTKGDRSGSCTIDLTRTWDPDAQAMTIDGAVCGREVHIVRGRARG